MRISLAVVGKFHYLDVAACLHKMGVLEKFYSTYPQWKLNSDDLPPNKISTFPVLHAAYMGLLKTNLAPHAIRRSLERWDRTTFQSFVARKLPRSDAFVALSGCGLRPGRKAQADGAVYICERGSTHIRYQEQILVEEHRLLGLPFAGIDPRGVELEEQEYAQSNGVVVPSRFCKETFVAAGVDSEKVHVIPYGVNANLFCKSGDPPKNEFHVIYVGQISVRKGVIYLLRAFQRLKHPRKQLTLIGPIHRELKSLLALECAKMPSVKFHGHMPQHELRKHMSSSHVLALPTLEEGLALVQAQAMACGCPIVTTPNSGAEDLIEDGVEGFIIPTRNVDALTQRLEQLADDPLLQERLSRAALARASALGGWETYCQGLVETIRKVRNGHRSH